MAIGTSPWDQTSLSESDEEASVCVKIFLEIKQKEAKAFEVMSSCHAVKTCARRVVKIAQRSLGPLLFDHIQQLGEVMLSTTEHVKVGEHTKVLVVLLQRLCYCLIQV
jgi:hypothetical protein